MTVAIATPRHRWGSDVQKFHCRSRWQRARSSGNTIRVSHGRTARPRKMPCMAPASMVPNTLPPVAPWRECQPGEMERHCGVATALGAARPSVALSYERCATAVRRSLPAELGWPHGTAGRIHIADRVEVDAASGRPTCPQPVQQRSSAAAGPLASGGPSCLRRPGRGGHPGHQPEHGAEGHGELETKGPPLPGQGEVRSASPFEPDRAFEPTSLRRTSCSGGSLPLMHGLDEDGMVALERQRAADFHERRGGERATGETEGVA